MRPYERLAGVYDRWTAQNDYAGWAQYLRQTFRELSPGARLLDVCCGTGRLTALLQQQGYHVTGVDRSEAMLAEAARALRPGTPLHRADLAGSPRAEDLPPLFRGDNYDAAVCTFDSVNYFTGDGELRTLLGLVARTLRPGGLFVFDVNTRQKLEKVFADSHYGDDLGDFGYIWRNRYDSSTQTIRFLITLFTRDGEHYRRGEEEHCQRWFTHEEITAAAQATGFSVRSVTDDYSDRPVTQETLRETWVLRCDSGA
jgi:ubiquinone/menaquinone biosynthesis C-methylase UbiE